MSGRASGAARRRARRALIGFTTIPLIVAALFTLNPAHAPHIVKVAGAAASGIHKIRHVIVIMQENRSFDDYFGTFPGADGIPMANGVPTVCVPDPTRGGCDTPYVDHNDVVQGGPHGAGQETTDLDGGKMDGFVTSAERANTQCAAIGNPNCADGPLDSTDVLGYHTQSDIPNYWEYASDYVLQDHMFEPNASWSLPAHLFMVSEWSAYCTSHNPSSCVNAVETPGPTPPNGNPVGVQPGPGSPIYAWTDLTYLLHKQKVSWGYYVTSGAEPDCANPAQLSCVAVPQNPRTPGIWNPLPYFDTVQHDKQQGNIQSVSKFYSGARAGTLPAVSWVVPSADVSEHPPSTTSAGQSYVTSLINAVMQGPDWSSTAIFLAWDDWGGFYDNIVPPTVDENGYGLRVPGLVISPYAKQGYIDHQTLSFDAYAKFIEDDFLAGRRLDPATDGRPDPRPSVREDAPVLGNLVNDFDFNQSPRPPTILPVDPATTLTDRPPFEPIGVVARDNQTVGRVTVRWQPPISNGGSPITAYQVTPDEDGLALPPQTFGSHVQSAILAGLTPSALYTFTVAAVNQQGVGVPSAPTAVVNG